MPSLTLTKEVIEDYGQLVKRWYKSPLLFVKDNWGLVPERDNAKFIKGRHITAHQHDILLAIEKALRGEAPRRISVAAGRGIGKSTTLSWLMLWWLFCYEDAQVAATSPSFQQLNDVLWKEIYLWKEKMPNSIKQVYEWTSDYVRHRFSPETWFARAKTARKENPEALAGVHGDYVMIVADEGSGIEDEHYKIAEGGLTGKLWLLIIISNPRRLVGYFYDTHHKNKDRWQSLQFNSLDSPIVDHEFIEQIKAQYGEDSDTYRIEVLGQFPREDLMDSAGWVPVFIRERINFTPEYSFRNTASLNKYLGVDPAGEGKDKSVWVVRDTFGLQKVAEENISNPKSVAEKTITLSNLLGIKPENVFIDGFGVGAQVAREVFMADGGKANVVLTSEKPSDEQYLNLRAELGFKFNEWLVTGGKIVNDKCWEELNAIKYKRNLAGKMQIMDKVTMRKLLGKSPDYFDAACLTFMNYQSLSKEIGGERKSYIPHHSYHK